MQGSARGGLSPFKAWLALIITLGGPPRHPVFDGQVSQTSLPSESLGNRGGTVTHKQPRSVQVVIFSESNREVEFLLLKRLESHGGFWQTVTGSLEETESHVEAAIREVKEETGILAAAEQLIDLQLVNTFEIAPQWRVKYAPGVTHNEEVCFALRIDKQEIQIDPKEHDSWVWADSSRAHELLFWESSKRALATLLRKLE